MKKTILFTLICFLTLSCAGFAREPHPEKPMMPDGKWWQMPKVSEKLNLTGEEKEKLYEFYIQNRSKLIDLEGSVKKEGFVLEQIIENDNMDKAACMEQFKKLQDVRTKVEVESFRFFVEVRKLLGYDRFQQFKKIFAKNYEPRMKDKKRD
jgi:Spy/CpxP family protein refolding chaperone